MKTEEKEGLFREHCVALYEKLQRGLIDIIRAKLQPEIDKIEKMLSQQREELKDSNQKSQPTVRRKDLPPVFTDFKEVEGMIQNEKQLRVLPANVW